MTVITRDQIAHYLHRGDQKDAIALLYKNYSAMLYGYILKFVGNEYYAQEILVNLFTSLPSVLLQELPEQQSVYCWLQQKARHFILSFLELKGEQSVATGSFRFLENTDANDRIIFLRIYLQGCSRKEVATELNISEEKVALSLFNSVKILRNI